MNPAPPLAVTVCGIEELAGHGVREKAWPNLRLVELGDAALDRGGALVAATHALHRLQLDVRPHIAEFMTGAGREREVMAARASAPL